MNLCRRVYHIAHSRDGFLLRAEDEHLAYAVADRAVDLFMTAIGDPCCNENHVLNIFPGEWVDSFVFQILNAPCRLYRLNRQVGEIPLTDEQALMLRPSVKDWFTEGPLDDEDESEYTDCCMTGRSLGDGWHSFGCENFQGDTLSQLKK